MKMIDYDDDYEIDCDEDDCGDDDDDDDNDDDDDIHLNNMSVNFSPDNPVSYFPELFAVNLITF